MSDIFTPNYSATNPESLVDVAGTPIRSKGDYGSILGDTLFNGTATGGAWITSAYLGVPREMSIYLSSVGSATMTIETSIDGTNWYFAVNEITGALVAITLTTVGDPTDPTAGGTAIVKIEAAPYYRVKCSASNAIIVQHILKY